MPAGIWNGEAEATPGGDAPQPEAASMAGRQRRASK